jgi:hypothetical protein
MNVERNVLGPTGLAEAMSGNKHLHDRFTCQNKTQEWHLRIYRLKTEAYKAEMNGVTNLEELRKTAEKEILEILTANGIT